MKVIKRDGRAVDYNREKIVTDIAKANQEVKQKSFGFALNNSY